jgi:DNA-binding MarR family transcriptional regulator
MPAGQLGLHAPAGPHSMDDGLGPAVHDLLTLLPPIFYALRSGPPIPALERLVRPLGPRHYPALMLIAAGQPLTVGALAERLHFSLATTSQLVADLYAARLVQRRQDPADRRRTLVEVSPLNAAAVQEWYATRAEPLRRALERLTPDERRTLIASLTIIAEEVARSSGPA